MSTRELGVQGEAVAARYYQRLGFRLFAHHYVTRLGELDLVLTSRDLVVIAEVKTRTNPTAAAPREAVDVHKQRRILMAARQFLAGHPDFAQRQIRFDVVEVVPCPGGWQVRCFPGAFEAGG